MTLFLAAIHLHRARLFGRPAVGESGSVGRPATAPSETQGTGGRQEITAYPWQSPRYDLAEARRLIDKQGYHRRDEEPADCENLFQ